MGLWNFYFLAKLYLYFRGFIRLDLLLSLLFAAFLVMPLPERLESHKPVKAVRLIAGIIIAVALLWKESWLPPPLDALNHLVDQGMPTGEYIASFLLRFFAPLEIMALLVILTFCFLLRNRKFLTPAVMVLFTATSLTGFSSDPKGGDLDKHLEAFYRSESNRIVEFKKEEAGNPGFDIVILHVCSISWDDMEEGGVEWRTFFDQFHYLFTDFNTVTAYSGPSVIRMMRSNCGQQNHASLYGDAPGDCYLFDNLTELGYETYFSANHNAEYGNFAYEAKTYGHLDAPLISVEDLPVQQFMFDDSIVYNDYAALEKWWKIRQESNTASAALYYNTLTLHEGSHWAPKRKEWWNRDRVELFREFTAKLFEDINRFFDLLESSGRNTVVLFVTEHGLALRGSTIQVAGLRDIPLPYIVTGPVGIKFIGKGFKEKPVNQQVISKPVSYMALSSALAALFEESPFGSEKFNTGNFADMILTTSFVAENEGAKVLKSESDIFFYGKEKKWIKLPEN